jgi:hypothetical protein
LPTTRAASARTEGRRRVGEALGPGCWAGLGLDSQVALVAACSSIAWACGPGGRGG